MKYLEPKLAYLEESDLYSLPKRPENSNKGSFGKLLIIAGSINMAGAAVLSAKAAYRSGTGLVKVFTPEANRIIIQTAVPEAILSTYDDNLSQETFLNELNWADAIVIGPGLGQSKISLQLVSWVGKFANVPVLWDADALNIIAKERNVLDALTGTHIFTPHVGEFSRLSGKEIPDIKEAIVESAVLYAKDHKITCVLKDYRTVIASNDDICFINMSGNNGMATAGSGDVLSGIIGAFLAQGYEAPKAARYGVFIHGLAGDYARDKMGVHAMMASDLIEELKSLWKKVDEHAE